VDRWGGEVVIKKKWLTAGKGEGETPHPGRCRKKVKESAIQRGEVNNSRGQEPLGAPWKEGRVRINGERGKSHIVREGEWERKEERK